MCFSYRNATTNKVEEIIYSNIINRGCRGAVLGGAIATNLSFLGVTPTPSDRFRMGTLMYLITKSTYIFVTPEEY